MPEAQEALMNYAWPGNIRELDKTINRLSDIKTGIVKLEDLSPAIRYQNEITASPMPEGILTRKLIEFVKNNGGLIPLYKQLEKEIILYANQELNGKKTEITKKYHIPKTKLWEFFKHAPTELHQ
jgi:DNA-binding NtrC family response regulator